MYNTIIITGNTSEALNKVKSMGIPHAHLTNAGTSTIIVHPDGYVHQEI